MGVEKRRHVYLRIQFGEAVAAIKRQKQRAGKTAIGIWQRTSQRRYPIKLWWILKPEVEIKPDWPFEDEVVAVANRELHDNFWASLEEAWSKRKR